MIQFKAQGESYELDLVQTLEMRLFAFFALVTFASRGIYSLTFF